VEKSDATRDKSVPGKMSLGLVIADTPEPVLSALRVEGYRGCTGRAGSTEIQKILQAIETAALREGVVSDDVIELHALYHAAHDAMLGLLRGDMSLGSLLRTVGLRFAVVRSPEDGGRSWVAVAVYGSIGSFMKGKEHEAAGLGISHL